MEVLVILLRCQKRVSQQLLTPGVAKPLALVCLAASAVLAHACAQSLSSFFPCCALLGRSKGSRSLDIPRAGCALLAW